MSFLRQTWALSKKNLLIIVRRHWFSTIIRALILPLGYILLISYVRLFFLPPSVYGFGEAEPIRSPVDAFTSQSSRSRIVLINSGQAGDIDTAIESLRSLYESVGADVRLASSESDLPTLCRSSLTGTSRCYGAVSFWTAPSDGEGVNWDYTAFQDFGLGLRINVNQNSNDAQVYGMPWVAAIDSAIANASGLDLPQQMLEMPFTSETLQEREDRVQSLFTSALASYLGLVIFIAICGITYHLPGHVARERELGMSSLIDTMNPTKRQWLSHAARILSTNIAFNLTYLPGTIAVGGIIAGRIFFRTSAGMQILFHILMCFSLAAYSNFFATFFRKAQLSGITIVILSCILAIVAQWSIPSIGVVQAVLSVLLPPINYTRWTIYLASAESRLEGASMGAANTWESGGLPGYFYIVAALIQTVLFLGLTLLAERLQYGTTSSARKADKQSAGNAHALRIQNFSCTYKPSLWARIRPWKRAETVHAVSHLTFAALRGQLIALLGENGSGKTTTISAITAQERVKSGVIELDGTGGLGFCPQKNVLWDELTVLEHVRIFNQLKSASKPDSKDALYQTINACDLGHKMKAKTKTLSGGQKRKVQLAMAFTGGSKVCCVDEASSGLDPVSRRKIWDILLSERGHRTLLFTTHALDEADALSDHIVILQKGRLKMEGSAVELKQWHGGDYQIHVEGSLSPDFPVGSNVRHETLPAGHIFHISSPNAAGQFIERLEEHGIHDYEVQGPTIEQVFLRQADQSTDSTPHRASPTPTATRPGTETGSDVELTTIAPKGVVDSEQSPQLAESRPIGFFGQVWVLFRKRWAILPRNWLPYFFALLIPIITAGLATSFLQGFAGLDCSPDALAINPGSVGLRNFLGRPLPVGPTSEISSERLNAVFGPYIGGFSFGAEQLVDPQDTYDDWEGFIRTNFRTVAPGGYWLGDQSNPNSTIAYRIDGGLGPAAALKAAVDSYLLNIPIGARFGNFALPLAGSTGDSLQLVIYFGLAMAIAPGLFALYPSYERTRNIKALQYSNGVRPAPLWLAHLLFDSMFVIIISSAALAIFSTVRGEVWISIGHLWPAFLFYGLSAILFAYTASLFLSTQLGAFAFAAGYQAVTLVLYFFIYLLLLAFSVADSLVDNLATLQFTFGLISPSGNLLRTLLLGLNQSQLLCENQTYRSPSSMYAFAGPIVILFLQILCLYAFLVSYDSGYFTQARPYITGLFKRKSKTTNQEEKQSTTSDIPSDVLKETTRTENSPGDALRVLHLSKAFHRNQPVVSNLTFGVQSSESFALLGPNGAGKTTTISLIRGHLKPTPTPNVPFSDILIDGHSLTHNRSAALLSQGVCPQFDAIDMLTVQQHLELYARAAGIPSRSIAPTVTYILRAVGLSIYARRLAATLSGGNKRKLSLAIAVVGNPKVLLLDEPSSGMDAVSKRMMWRALEAVKGLGRGRSMAMVITSHSMEEVSALSDRVGIMRGGMLAVGGKGELIRRYGDRWHVHVMLRGSVVGDEEVEGRVRGWIEGNVRGARIEREMLHGQLRFWVPRQRDEGRGSGLAEVFRLLEENKEGLCIEYYSVVQTNLEDVFLNVVGQQED